MLHTHPFREEEHWMPQQPKSFRHRAEDFIRLVVPDWRPSLGQNLWAIRIVVSVLGILTLASLPFNITRRQWLDLLITLLS
jgi:hypothetical protein